MELSELDDLKLHFENALQRWTTSIQHLQDLLAKTTHSAQSEDIWKQADFEQEDAQAAVKKARRAYEDAVRRANFGF